MQFWQSSKTEHFTIQAPEWTAEDDADMRELMTFPHSKKLLKCLHKRMQALTESLVNGEDTRSRIAEVKDLVLELQNYANPD